MNLHVNTVSKIAINCKTECEHSISLIAINCTTKCENNVSLIAINCKTECDHGLSLIVTTIFHKDGKLEKIYYSALRHSVSVYLIC